MRVERIHEGLAVAIPEEVVKGVGLEPGDELEFVIIDADTIQVKRTLPDRRRGIERLMSHAIDFPAEYRFDREDANAR